MSIGMTSRASAETLNLLCKSLTDPQKFWVIVKIETSIGKVTEIIHVGVDQDPEEFSNGKIERYQGTTFYVDRKYFVSIGDDKISYGYYTDTQGDHSGKREGWDWIAHSGQQVTNIDRYTGLYHSGLFDAQCNRVPESKAF